jgi:hypothetical protein
VTGACSRPGRPGPDRDPSGRQRARPRGDGGGVARRRRMVVGKREEGVVAGPDPANSSGTQEPSSTSSTQCFPSKRGMQSLRPAISQVRPSPPSRVSLTASHPSHSRSQLTVRERTGVGTRASEGGSESL